MKIYKTIRPFMVTLGGYAGIGVVSSYKEGDLFFKPKDESEYTTIGPSYYPEFEH